RIPSYLGALLPHLPPKGRIAETGCGNARLLHALKRQGFEVVGTEFSQGVIARVSRLTEVPILRGGVERLEPGSFDALVSIDVLEHVHDPRQLLSADARAAKPAARSLVHTPAHETPPD